jgi:hypothetical protein
MFRETEKAKIPMLFYNDHIPDLELCKVDIAGNQADIDSNVQTTRNEYQQKYCFYFILLETGPIFPYLKRDGHFLVRLKIMDFFFGMQ